LINFTIKQGTNFSRQIVLQLNPPDNVLIAVKDLNKGETVKWHRKEFKLLDDVGCSFKSG
jgi:altronate hydrolase